MINRLLPWKLLLRLAAKRFDIVDPLSVAARIRSFAQPSEVQEPIELLRAGIVFHARGLVNTKAIQHNLDWVWPYWVEQQFNPQTPSFIPRAFSFSHINLTHRNWIAVGQPDLPIYPIVDPRGLVTPLHDGWSIDCWFIDDEGNILCPSRLERVEQKLYDDTNRRVVTSCSTDTADLVSEVAMDTDGSEPTLKLAARVNTSVGGWLIFSLRPYNPEGVQFIEDIELLRIQNGWLVNDTTKVLLSQKPAKILFSNYREGDVFFRLHEHQAVTEKSCRIGMVTSAAFHRVEAARKTENFLLTVPMPPAEHFPHVVSSRTWPEAENEAARLQVPDEKITFLYKAATRTLIHLSAGDVVPGSYTYNRFWFRDGCIMLNALLNIGLTTRCLRHLNTFSDRQTKEGFFHSQDGEWDSNGQVLWLLNRYRLLSDGDMNPQWLDPLWMGAEWIGRKRVFSTENIRINGLLPSGFSAEHFGPNDHYYWDDFWAVAGLFGAADIMAIEGRNKEEKTIRRVAVEMKDDLLRSIARVAAERNDPAIPSSPNRRLDSSAIGSIVADYPLQLLPPGDRRTLATADFLFDNCLQKGCFFQDMIHSGLNIYMTLELAQVYLRAGDLRFRSLLSAAASFASSTGQWPEAIHPRTEGGCMGDGQHGWAAAEWVMLIRNMFIMDEKDSLIIGGGILPEWLQENTRLVYGPTLTPFGKVTVMIDCDEKSVKVELTANWYRHRPQNIFVRLPDHTAAVLTGPDYNCTVRSKK
ncbi:MAG: hypothetical protein ACWGOX_00850 [Desulforhopalus sp.]